MTHTRKSMQTKTIIAHSLDELRINLNNNLSSSFQPTMAFCFASTVFELEEISKTFNSCGIKLVGATSAGEICDDEVSRSSISVILLELDRAHFKIYAAEYTNTESVYQTCFELGSHIGY